MTTDIKTRITAEDRFSRTFASLRRDLSGVQQGLAGIGAGLSAAVRVGTLGAVAGLGAFALAARSLVNELDNLNDSADATGATVEALSALEDVARRNGGTLDLVTDALVKMNQALNLAKPGSEQEAALRAIGVEAARLRALAPEQALLEIAKALAQFENDGTKARIAQVLFGKSLREIAPFLNDLVAAGDLNAKVTAEQAAEAEKFNKQLFELQTNVSNVARGIVSDMLPALNAYLKAVREAPSLTSRFGRFVDELSAEVQSLRLTAAVKQVEDLTGALAKDPANPALAAALKRAREDADALSRSAQQAADRLRGLVTVQESARNAGGGRGFVNPDLPKQKLDDFSGAPQAAKISEAQRYLESLQRQIEKTQDLTAVEQLQLDIRLGRIDGLTPKIRAQLELEARRLDTIKAQDKALKDQQDSLDQLIESSLRSANELDRLLAATPTGRRQEIERQVDRVLKFARANPDDDRIQRQASEVLTRLRADMDALDKDAEDVKTEWDKVADTIEKSMDRATGAVLDFAIDGKGNLVDVGRAIARDIARGLIEDPLRDEVKQLGKNIADGLKKTLQGEDIFGSLFDGLKKLFSGGSGDGFFDSLLSGIGSLFGGGTGRALGGPVKAGQLVRWQENGREWFVPQEDGTVVTESQMRRSATAAGGTTVNYAPVIHVNGDVGPATVQLVQAMLDRNNTRLVRSLRTGGVMAG